MSRDLSYGAAIIGLVLGARNLTQQDMFLVSRAFAVFNVFAHAGALVGPLLGAALLTTDCRLVTLVACLAFVVLTVARTLVLPLRCRARDVRGGRIPFCSARCPVSCHAAPVAAIRAGELCGREKIGVRDMLGCE